MQTLRRALPLILIFASFLLTIFAVGCAPKTQVPQKTAKVAPCVYEFETTVKICPDARRPLSNKVQDGSLIKIVRSDGVSFKAAAYFDARYELCLPPTYKNYLKEGERVKVEVLRCGYSNNEPYCPWTVKEGLASWYGYGDGSGEWTASGRRFVPESFGLANKELPFGTLVKITNLENGRSTYAVVLDRGPFVEGRDFDLYPKTMRAIGGIERGVVPVRVEVLRCGWDVRP